MMKLAEFLTCARDFFVLFILICLVIENTTRPFKAEIFIGIVIIIIFVSAVFRVFLSLVYKTVDEKTIDKMQKNIAILEEEVKELREQ